MSAPGPDRPIAVFFGHHKCATSWVDRILLKTAAKLAKTMRIVHTPRDFGPYASPGELAEAEGVQILAITNAELRWLDELPPFRGFHLIRDPRDLVVSGYFSHRFSHGDRWPELNRHRAELERLDVDEGLFSELDFSGRFIHEMGAWDYGRDDVLELRLEDLVVDEVATMTDALRFLGLVDDGRSFPAGLATVASLQTNHVLARAQRSLGPRAGDVPLRREVDAMPEWFARRFLARQRFERVSGRHRGHEETTSHYRKGVPGDWVNHFTAEHRAEFERRYGDVTRRLGYADQTP